MFFLPRRLSRSKAELTALSIKNTKSDAVIPDVCRGIYVTAEGAIDTDGRPVHAVVDITDKEVIVYRNMSKRMQYQNFVTWNTKAADLANDSGPDGYFKSQFHMSELKELKTFDTGNVRFQSHRTTSSGTVVNPDNDQLWWTVVWKPEGVQLRIYKQVPVGTINLVAQVGSIVTASDLNQEVLLQELEQSTLTNTLADSNHYLNAWLTTALDDNTWRFNEDTEVGFYAGDEVAVDVAADRIYVFDGETMLRYGKYELDGALQKTGIFSLSGTVLTLGTEDYTVTKYEDYEKLLLDTTHTNYAIALEFASKV